MLIRGIRNPRAVVACRHRNDVLRTMDMAISATARHILKRDGALCFDRGWNLSLLVKCRNIAVWR